MRKKQMMLKELFLSLQNRYQDNLEKMRGSEFVSDYINLLHYKCHKINPNRGESYIIYMYIYIYIYIYILLIKSKVKKQQKINKKVNKFF